MNTDIDNQESRRLWLERKIKGYFSELDILFILLGVLVIFWGGLFFWFGWTPLIEKPSASRQIAIAAADAGFIVAWVVLVAQLHQITQVKASQQAEAEELSAAKYDSRPILEFSRPPDAQNKRIINLHCINVGKGTAFNIECKLRAVGTGELPDPRTIRQSNLPPQQHFLVDLLRGVKGLEDPPTTAPALVILIRYNDSDGTPFPRTMSVDENRFPFFDDYVPVFVDYLAG